MCVCVCVCVCVCICEECNRSSDLDRNSQTTVLQYIYYINAVNNELFFIFPHIKRKKYPKKISGDNATIFYLFSIYLLQCAYIYISHVKYFASKIKKMMMGLRSPKNYFRFYFFDLFIWEKIKNGPLFTTYKVNIDGTFENSEALRERRVIWLISTVPTLLRT